MGCFEPRPVFPGPGAFRLPFVHFLEEKHGWKKLVHLGQQVEKGGGGRFLRGRHQKINFPFHNLH